MLVILAFVGGGRRTKVILHYIVIQKKKKRKRKRGVGWALLVFAAQARGPELDAWYSHKRQLSWEAVTESGPL